jgi:hypothetical protein
MLSSFGRDHFNIGLSDTKKPRLFTKTVVSGELVFSPRNRDPRVNAKRGASESFPKASLYPAVDKGFATKRKAISDSLIPRRERSATPHGPSDACNQPKTLSLSLQIGVLVNEPVCFGPRNEPVAKTGLGVHRLDQSRRPRDIRLRESPDEL